MAFSVCSRVASDVAQLTAKQVAGIVADIGPPSGTTVAEWVAKSRQESGHRDDIEDFAGSGHWGLWQISETHWKTLNGRYAGHPQGDEMFASWLRQPRYNFVAAKILFEKDGWRPWNASGGKPTPNAADKAAAGSPEDTAGSDVLRGAGDLVESGVDAVTDPLGAIVGPIMDAVALLKDAAVWISDRDNWIRILQVGGGVALALVAASIVVKPIISSTAKTVSPI